MVGEITTVWGEVMEWIISSLTAVQVVFYTADNKLTFLGTLAIIAVAIGIAFLLIGVIQNFLHLRG